MSKQFIRGLHSMRFHELIVPLYSEIIGILYLFLGNISKRTWRNWNRFIGLCEGAGLVCCKTKGRLMGDIQK